MSGTSPTFPPEAAGLLGGFQIIDCTNPNWSDELKLVLGASSSAYDRPFQSILSHVASLGCRSILVEPYISTDWADEYQAWYSRLFREMPRIAKRLHFFRGVGESSRPVRLEDIYNLPNILGKLDSSHQYYAYLGYVVIRPLMPLTVSETVLRPPPHSYVPCIGNFSAHLLGYKLSLKGMPFMQQEQGVSVCAEAALWMLARYKHALGISRRYRPSEMEHLAAEQQRLGSTRDGLTDDQMYSALWKMKFNPSIFTTADKLEFAHYLYTYLRSGIPILVTLDGPRGGHAITVVGFENPDSSKAKKSLGRKWPRHLPHRYLIHDDQLGPYQPVELGEGEDGKTKYPVLNQMRVAACFASIPQRVHLTLDDVIPIARRWLDGLIIAQGTAVGTPKSYWKESELEGLAMRACLMQGNNLKKSVSDLYLDKEDNIHLVARYWKSTLPKHVWLVELYDKKKAAEADAMVGHMVFDATAHYRDVERALLILHLKGRLLVRNPIHLRLDADNAAQPEWSFTGNLPSPPYHPFYPA